MANSRRFSQSPIIRIQSVSIILFGCVRIQDKKRLDRLWHPSINVNVFATSTACCETDLQIISRGYWISTVSFVETTQAIRENRGKEICPDEWTDATDGQPENITPSPTLSVGTGTKIWQDYRRCETHRWQCLRTILALQLHCELTRCLPLQQQECTSVSFHLTAAYY